MRNFLLYFFLLIGVFSSCKKEELNGDLAYLEGKWKLSIVLNNVTGWSGPPQGEKVCYLEFKHSGKVLYRNGSDMIIERGRIISAISDSGPTSIYPGSIYYELVLGSNAVFERRLDKLNSIILLPNICPNEIITNDIVYGTSNGEHTLVFQKMDA